MKKEDLILNTIAFKEQMDAGVPQADLIKLANRLGVKRLEIRREFLRGISEELPRIREAADQYHFDLFYSVNEDFVLDGAVNPLLEQLLEEAQILEAPFIKLNTGDVGGVQDATFSSLNELIEKYGVGIRLENNQTPGHANVANCLKAMQLVETANLPITFVFDTANWVFVGDSVEKAVEQLAEFTTYLHCKNYQLLDGKPVLSGLFDGELDIITLKNQFPHLEYVALEYPCALTDLEKDIRQFTELS